MASSPLAAIITHRKGSGAVSEYGSTQKRTDQPFVVVPRGGGGTTTLTLAAALNFDCWRRSGSEMIKKTRNRTRNVADSQQRSNNNNNSERQQFASPARSTNRAAPYNGIGMDRHDSDSMIQQQQQDENHDHKTTFWQTYIHLLKGYIGPGCLSLPWVVSQLGIPIGCAAICIVAALTSYNSWTVVKLKRYMEQAELADTTNMTTTTRSATDNASERGDVASVVTTTNTNITYPDVGEWAYGKKFHSYVSACVCVQQLAVCTVFFSFIGENIQAVLHRIPATSGTWLDSHVFVLCIALPTVLCFSFLPHLKALAPVTFVGTIFLFASFAALAWIGFKEWDHRPATTPSFHVPQLPLAVCAILYSYEGICLILPVESAMQQPAQFQAAFVLSMMTVSVIFAAVASLSVLAFGTVTNGSITAFLVTAYASDATVTIWIMIANTLVSLSVLLTYPLQLFPAVEILASALLERSEEEAAAEPGATATDLNAFEPLPPWSEDDNTSPLPLQHEYGNTEQLNDQEDGNDSASGSEAEEAVDRNTVTNSLFPQMTIPGDSPFLRLGLVLGTFFVAAVIPNVQTLISLAGAVAGSSVALLIPPILELAWIEHLQQQQQQQKTSIPTTPRISRTLSSPRPAMPQRYNNITGNDGRGDDALEIDGDDLGATRFTAANYWRTLSTDPYLQEKIKSWLLLLLGVVFALIGSIASVRDIVEYYAPPDKNR